MQHYWLVRWSGFASQVGLPNYDRLITLVLHDSPRLWKKNYTLDPNKMKDRNKKQWALKEDVDLLESVIKTQKKIVSSVEGIEDDHVDWSSLAKHKNRFGERSTQNLREHWKRIIYPALIESPMHSAAPDVLPLDHLAKTKTRDRGEYPNNLNNILQQ